MCSGTTGASGVDMEPPMMLKCCRTSVSALCSWCTCVCECSWETSTLIHSYALIHLSDSLESIDSISTAVDVYCTNLVRLVTLVCSSFETIDSRKLLHTLRTAVRSFWWIRRCCRYMYIERNRAPSSQVSSSQHNPKKETISNYMYRHTVLATYTGTDAHQIYHWINQKAVDVGVGRRGFAVSRYQRWARAVSDGERSGEAGVARRRPDPRGKLPVDHLPSVRAHVPDGHLAWSQRDRDLHRGTGGEENFAESLELSRGLFRRRWESEVELCHLGARAVPSVLQREAHGRL